MVSRVGFEPTTLGLKVLFLKEKLMSGLSLRTIEFYEQKLNKLTAHQTTKTILEYTRQDILHNLGTSQGDKRAHLRVFKVFYNWVEDSGFGNTGNINPCRRLKIKSPKPLRHAVKLGEVPALLEGCTTIRNKLVVSLLCETGLRLSELESIKTQDIDFEARTIKVWGKGSKQRIVSYGEITGAFLGEYKHEDEQYLGITYNAIKLMLHKLGKATGIKCNPHAFRRMFATESVRNGMNLFHVQSLLEHSNLTMTRVYAEQVDSEDAVIAYKPILK
jgi:integrase/recombinase XerC